jgi:hypothetical protein
MNFEGRVNQSSKKNIQIEYKSRVDDKIKLSLQHGAYSDGNSSKSKKLYILDFKYPFSTL